MWFPHTPMEWNENNQILDLPLEVIFFIFGVRQNEYLQYTAAKTLQANVLLKLKFNEKFNEKFKLKFSISLTSRDGGLNADHTNGTPKFSLQR